MDSENKLKIHPLTAIAAIAIIVACLVGIAAMLGVLPTSNKNAPPVATTAMAETTASAAAATPAPASVANNPAPAAEKAPAPAPKVVRKKPVRRAPAATNPDDNYSNYPSRSASCSNCGVVESVRAVEHEGNASGVGMGVGAVVGGLLGNQIGSGNGRTLATIAGAVGGGYAGNTIEKRRNTTTSYEVTVQMDNGSRQRFNMREQRWRAGDLVRVENGSLVAR